MSKQNLKFVASRTIQKPIRVKFRTKSGKTVSFKAVKTFEKKTVVRFRLDLSQLG
jgi:hypothetical protein